MLAMAMIALFAAVMPAQEGFEDLDNQELESALYEDTESEEIVLNDESEYADEIVFEDESEILEDLTPCEEEE